MSEIGIQLGVTMHMAEEIGAREAADILDISPSYLHRLARRGLIPELHKQPGRAGRRTFDRITLQRIARELGR